MSKSDKNKEFVKTSDVMDLIGFELWTYRFETGVVTPVHLMLQKYHAIFAIYTLIIFLLILPIKSFAKFFGNGLIIY